MGNEINEGFLVSQKIVQDKLGSQLPVYEIE